MVGWNITDNLCLAKSPRAHVTSDGVNSTAWAWKIPHWKPHTTGKLKPCMHINSERMRTFILHDITNDMWHVITHKKSHNVLSKFMILCWAIFTAILGCMQPTGCRLDIPGWKEMQIWQSNSGGEKDQSVGMLLPEKVLTGSGTLLRCWVGLSKDHQVNVIRCWRPKSWLHIF